jgi:hypothetical protein
MPTRDDLFPSKHLKYTDLNGKPAQVEIEKAPTETFKENSGKEQHKTVLYFKGASKDLPLNMTNWDSVAKITGCSDSDDWAGHVIELYESETTMGGKTVGCIRIRAPSKKKPTAAKLPKPKPVLPEPPEDDPEDPGFSDDDARERGEDDNISF